MLENFPSLDCFATCHSNMYLFPEVLRIGLEAGLDVETMVEVIRVSTGNSWFSDQWRSTVSLWDMLMKNPNLHETLNLIAVKDIQTTLEWTEELGYESPILKAVFRMVKIGVESTGVINEKLFEQIVKEEVKL